MPSQNKTANYNLNQWQGTEYPMRNDFNDDNAKIDAALKGISDRAVHMLETNAFDFADPGTLYPVGISLFQFNASGVGYPTAGGQVLTFKTNDDRISQIITETNVTSPKTWTREYRVSNAGWSNLLLNVNETSGDVRYIKKSGDTMTGELSVPNLILLGRPLRVNYSTLYIDEINGNDANDGLTQSTAVKTSAGLNAKLPIFLNATLTVKVIGNFTGVLFISTVLTPHLNSLARYLTIEGDTQNKNNHTVFGIRVNGCTAGIRTKYISVIGNALVFENCLGAYVSDCTLTTNASSAGALAFISSNGKVENCEINNSLSTGILANQGSVINVVNNTGVCVNAYATLGGIIIKSGTQPSGNEVIQNGGAIFNECRGNEPPKETIITNGFASGWSGTLRYGMTEDGEFYINHSGLIKTSDISPYEVIYTITDTKYSRYVGSASSFGLNASTIVVNNSTVTIHLESGGRLVASNHGSVTTNVRKVWPDTITARKF